MLQGQLDFRSLRTLCTEVGTEGLNGRLVVIGHHVPLRIIIGILEVEMVIFCRILIHGIHGARKLIVGT